jgi:stringent starvation protein B
MHQWMVDNGLTPHIVVDARHEGVKVPEAQIQDGKIVFNVSLSATRGLDLGNEFVSFEARFGGVPMHLDIPVTAVLGIYARETGQGMIFSEDESPGTPPPDAPASGDKRPKLTVVK